MVVQYVDGQVRDGDGSRGCESDQQHQCALTLLQSHVQSVCALLWEKRESTWHLTRTQYIIIIMSSYRISRVWQEKKQQTKEKDT